MKYALPLIVAALLALASPPVLALEQSIAATVNDAVITLGDVQDRAKLYLSANGQSVTQEQIKQATPKVLDKLIDEALQVQEAKKLGLEVSEQDLVAGFADIAKQNGLSADEFRAHLAQAGNNPDSLKNQVKADIAWSHVVRRKLRPQINISENEIDLAFDQAESGSGKTSYHLAEIFLAVSDKVREDSVREEAEKLMQQVRNGAPFSTIAREYSQSPGAAQGGDLGWVQPGQLEDALDAALSNLRPGQITPPIRTSKGYTLLFMIDARANTGANALLEEPVPQAAEGETVSLKQVLLKADPKKGREGLNVKALEAKGLQKKITDCGKMDDAIKKYASSHSRDMGKVPLARMPPQLRDIINKLKVGALSDPILAPDGIIVLMVCGRNGGKTEEPKTAETPALDKGDDASRDKVAVKLGSVRLDQMATRYLGDLRAAAFIEKRI